jgi:diphthine-ammonia ligase
MCDPDGTSKSHALAAALIEAQVRSLGGHWMPVRAASHDYARRFTEALQALRDSDHTHLVFGDIDLQAHRDWLEPMCHRAGLQAVFPLWGLARPALAQEVLARGIRARLVAVDTRHLDASFCGAEYDAALLARLPAGVCPCGEGGEFHTFVWDGPGFAAPLRLRAGAPVLQRSVPPLAPTTLALLPLALEDVTPPAP